MMHAPCGRPARPYASFERGNGEPGVDRAADRVAHYATRPSVENRCQIDEASGDRDIGVSRPKEFHLRPLAEPDVNLSAHPAPIIHPTTSSPSTNERMREADVVPAVGAFQRPAFCGPPTSCA